MEEAFVDEGRIFIDPLSESRASRPIASEDRKWIPVVVIRRVIDELAAATVARNSQARSSAVPDRRLREPEELRHLFDLLETLPTERRTAGAFRDDLVSTLHQWRVRARDGKNYYWTDRGG
jgi:hypothetical protein